MCVLLLEVLFCYCYCFKIYGWDWVSWVRGREEVINLFLKSNLQGGVKQLWWGPRVGVGGQEPEQDALCFETRTV